MILLLTPAKDDANRRHRTPAASAAERKPTLLECQRVKPVAMLGVHRMSKARKGRLQAKIADVDLN